MTNKKQERYTKGEKGGVIINNGRIIKLARTLVSNIKSKVLLIVIIIVAVILISNISFQKIIIAKFNNNYEIFSSSLKDIEELENKNSSDQIVILPKKYKKLSYNGKVLLYKHDQTKYISFVQRKNYIDRSYIQIVYTENNINDLKYCLYYDKIKFKKIKDNWYYVFVEKSMHEKYIPLGYYKKVTNYKRTYKWCFQDIDTCYVSYDKLYYKSIPNLIINRYEQINAKNKAKVIYKVFNFERNMNDGKGTLKYDFLMSTISKNDYIHIEEHDWSYELYLYDTDDNILYKFHGYD